MEKWRIVKDEITYLNDEQDFDTFLTEDMYQAVLDRYIIDSGWYLDESGEGSFITFFIKDNNWDSPLLKIVTKVVEDAKWSISRSMEYFKHIDCSGR